MGSNLDSGGKKGSGCVDGFNFRSDHQGTDFRARLLLFAVFTALLVYPPVFSFSIFRIKTIFGYFAADAFYYLTIAKNSVLGFMTFDGEKVTNGFQPLWQYLLLLIFKLSGHGQPFQLALTFWTSVGLTTLGLIFTGWAIQSITRSLSAALWLIPGLFFILSRIDTTSTWDTGLTYTYSVWAFMNGMETPLSIFFGGGLILLLARQYARWNHGPDPEQDPGREFSVSTCLALGFTLMFCILARLDDVFLLCGVLFLAPYLGRSRKQKIMKLSLIVMPAALALSIYLVHHYLTAQTLLPVSGIQKAKLSIFGNFQRVVASLFPLVHPCHAELPAMMGGSWIYPTTRITGLIIPPVVAAFLAYQVFSARLASNERRRNQWIFFPLLTDVLIKDAYIFCNVPFSQQGYWYHGLPILFVNFLLIVYVWRLFSGSGLVVPRPLRSLLILLWVIFYFLSSANVIQRSGSNTFFYNIWLARQEMTDNLKALDSRVKLIDCYDGIIGYSLDLPAMSGLGLAIDRDGYRESLKGRFSDYCISRGYTITASGPAGATFRPKGYDFDVIYRHHGSGIVFTKLAKSVPH